MFTITFSPSSPDLPSLKSLFPSIIFFSSPPFPVASSHVPSPFSPSPLYIFIFASFNLLLLLDVHPLWFSSSSSSTSLHLSSPTLTYSSPPLPLVFTALSECLTISSRQEISALQTLPVCSHSGRIIYWTEFSHQNPSVFSKISISFSLIISSQFICSSYWDTFSRRLLFDRLCYGLNLIWKSLWTEQINECKSV